MVHDPEARRSGRLPLALIAAVARNGVIGADNRLPWRLPEDLRHFRALTIGHAVLMGRRTWESLRGALPDRQNIVVTRNARYAAPGAETAASIDAALERIERPPPAFCIGGGELYRAALPLATTVHLTEIERDFQGDTTFPPLDPDVWREAWRERHAGAGAGDYDYAFVTYVRRDAGEYA
ncbi:MAG TPA: dihydrofolate reductase [Casimicrobiaceae bacterium]|jgi:dihydrofolate reductase